MTKPIDIVPRLRGMAAHVNYAQGVRAITGEAADSIEELRFWLQRSQQRERELRDQLANTQPMPFDDEEEAPND